MLFDDIYNKALAEHGAGGPPFFAGREKLNAPNMSEDDIREHWGYGGLPFIGTLSALLGVEGLRTSLPKSLTMRTSYMRQEMNKSEWAELIVNKLPNDKRGFWRLFLGADDIEASTMLRDVALAWQACDKHVVTGSINQYWRQLYHLATNIERFNGTKPQERPFKDNGLGLGDILRDSVVRAPRVFGDAVGGVLGNVANTAGETGGSFISGFGKGLGLPGAVFAGGIILILLLRK